MQPALAWIRSEYAYFLASNGRVEDAEREYHAALAEQPWLAATWFNLGGRLADPAHAEAAGDAGGARRWDLRDDGGRVVDAGLYRAQLAQRGTRGKPLPAQEFAFGIVRPHVR